jgi:RND family efflux transporter MFP subunit
VIDEINGRNEVMHMLIHLYEAKQTFKRFTWLLCIAVVLTACAEEPEIAKVIRPIETVTVGEQAAARIAKYSGIVAAVESSGLSFQIRGQVVSVEVDIGDSVQKGQVLAVLDPEPYQLDVNAAEAELATANDNVAKTKADYERQQRLFEQGAGAESRVDVTEFEYKSALSTVELQRAKLDQANRDLRNTTLPSPYDGVIAWRSVEPNEEVPAGQKILEINAAGKTEVQLAIPETSVDQLDIDDPAEITFPTLPGEIATGRISYIGGAAVKANAFPVKVELIDPNESVKPGMTAEASLMLRDESSKPGYLIPNQALMPAPEPNRGFVFVFDPDTSTVRKTAVRTSGAGQNKVIVDEGLEAGNVIAVAGVSFLADGMEVALKKGN